MHPLNPEAHGDTAVFALKAGAPHCMDAQLPAAAWGSNRCLFSKVLLLA